MTVPEIGPDMDHTPTPIHRAIDQVSILKIELHRIRQRLQAGETIDPDRLTIMEAALDEVVAVLLDCRDQADAPRS